MRAAYQYNIAWTSHEQCTCLQVALQQKDIRLLHVSFAGTELQHIRSHPRSDADACWYRYASVMMYHAHERSRYIESSLCVWQSLHRSSASLCSKNTGPCAINSRKSCCTAALRR